MPKGISRAVPPADIKHRADLRTSGMTTVEIAKTTGYSETTVCVRLRGLFPTRPHGRPRKKVRGPDDPLLMQIRAMRSEGKSFDKIAREIGRSKTFVARMLPLEERKCLYGRAAMSAPITEDEFNKMVEMRREGWPLKHIAAALGRSESAVYGRLGDMPEFMVLRVRGVDRPNATTDDIRALRAQGKSMRDIAAALNVSANYVLNRLTDEERYAFKTRKPNPKPVTEAERNEMRTLKAAGMNARQIGAKLNRAAHTVRDHLSGRYVDRPLREKIARNPKRRPKMPKGVMYPDFDRSDADRWREVRLRRAA